MENNRILLEKEMWNKVNPTGKTSLDQHVRF